MIGLYDCDLFSHSSLVRLPLPNLEAMKLSSYFVLNERKFCRLMFPSEQEFSGYETIYCFGEFNNEIPMQFRKAERLELVGTSFNNGNYVPFKNSLIDFTIPRTTIYKEFLREKLAVGYDVKSIEKFLNSSYYRIMAGNEMLPPPIIKKRNPLYIYDKNIFVAGWKDLMKELNSHSPSKIVCLHPIICDSIDLYLEAKNSGLSPANEYVIELNINLNQVNKLLAEYKNKLLAEITTNTQVYLPFGADKRTTQEYINNFIYTLNLIYSFWAKGIPIKLKFIEPSLGVKNPLFKISKKLETAFNISTSIKREATFLEKIPKGKDTEIYKEYELLYSYYPQIKDLFNQSYNKISRRGIWTI